MLRPMLCKRLRDLRAPILVALALAVPTACVSVATFIVQQYEGETRPAETISILRLNPAEPVVLVALDGEKLDFAVTERDSRIHIEMLPGQHVLDVGTIHDPIGVQRVQLWALPGATYRVALYGSASPAGGGVSTFDSRWTASVILVDAETDRVVAVAPTAEPRPALAPSTAPAAAVSTGATETAPTTPASAAAAAPPSMTTPLPTSTAALPAHDSAPATGSGIASAVPPPRAAPARPSAASSAPSAPPSAAPAAPKAPPTPSVNAGAQAPSKH